MLFLLIIFPRLGPHCVENYFAFKGLNNRVLYHA